MPRCDSMLQHPVQLMPMGIDTHSRHHLCKFSSAMPHSSGVCEEDCKIGVEKVRPRCKKTTTFVFFFCFFTTRNMWKVLLSTFNWGVVKGKRGRGSAEEGRGGVKRSGEEQNVCGHSCGKRAAQQVGRGLSLHELAEVQNRCILNTLFVTQSLTPCCPSATPQAAGAEPADVQHVF